MISKEVAKTLNYSNKFRGRICLTNQKKPENKDMVVAPVPIPPKESDPASPEKEPTSVAYR